MRAKQKNPKCQAKTSSKHGRGSGNMQTDYTRQKQTRESKTDNNAEKKKTEPRSQAGTAW